MKLSGKQILVLLSLLVLLSPFLNTAKADSITSGDFAYTNNGDGTATLTGYSGSNTELIIPNAIDGLTVTKIDNQAFTRKALTSISIPSTITSIGVDAFSYNNLTNLVIPNSVQSIGDSSFSDNKISSLVLSNSLTEIRPSAFSRNSLTSVTIPESVESIGGNAFMSNKITDLRLPNSLKEIGFTAFGDNLFTHVDLPANVSIVLGSAFAFCPNLEYVIVRNPDPSMVIGAGAFTGSASGFVLYGSPSSGAENFAKFYGISFSTNIPSNNSEQSSSATINLNPGQLESSQDPVNFSTVTIGLSSDQTSASNTSIYVKDSRGNGAGWSLSLSATDFTMSIPDPINDSQTITVSIPPNAVSAIVDNIVTLTGQTSQVSGGSVQLNLSPQKILESKPGFGMGSYSATLHLSLTVPKTVLVTAVTSPESKYTAGSTMVGIFAGTYSSTFTFTTTAGI